METGVKYRHKIVGGFLVGPKIRHQRFQLCRVKLRHAAGCINLSRRNLTRRAGIRWKRMQAEPGWHNPSNVRRSPSPVKREIPERVLVAGNAVAGAEQQTEMLVEVAGTAEIERGKALVFVRVPVLRKQFAAEREMFSEIPLHEPTAIGMVALAGREIQNFAGTAVGG